MIKSILDYGNYIVINRTLLVMLGLKSAVYLSELIHTNNMKKEEWFSIRQDVIEDHTTLSKYNQTKCKTELEKLGILTTKNGRDNRLIYKINYAEIEKLLTSRCSESEKLGNRNPKNLETGIQEIRKPESEKLGFSHNYIFKDIDINYKEASPYKQIVDYYYQRLKSALGEEKPPYNGGAGGKLFKNLLKKYSLEDCKRIVDAFFQDDFAKKCGFRVEIINTVLNRLIMIKNNSGLEGGQDGRIKQTADDEQRGTRALF